MDRSPAATIELGIAGCAFFHWFVRSPQWTSLAPETRSPARSHEA